MDYFNQQYPNNMYGYGGGYYGQQGMPQYWNGNPYMPQSIPMPQNVNALSDEEITVLRNAKPQSKINLTVDQTDYLRSLCTHKNSQTHTDVAQMVNDGSGMMWCPICGEKWDPTQLTKEQVKDLVDQFVSQIQNMKWIGDLPIEVTREYCAMLPLIKKFPDLYEYAVNNYDKYANSNPYQMAQDNSVYNQFNQLMNGGFQQYPMGGYMPNGYYQQPMMGQMQPMGQPANPNVNPMQANVPTPQQYQPQAQMMPQQPQSYVPNGYYGQPMMNPPMAPQMGMGQPMPPMPGQYSPVYQPAQQAAPAAAPQAQPATETKTEQVNL